MEEAVLGAAAQPEREVNGSGVGGGQGMVTEAPP